MRVPVVNVDGSSRYCGSIKKAVLRRHSVNLSFDNVALPRAAVACRKESDLSILTSEHLTICNLGHATVETFPVEPIGNRDGGRIRHVVVCHFHYLARYTEAFDTYSVETRINICSPAGAFVCQL